MNDAEQSATYARLRAAYSAGLARLVRGYAATREDQEDLLQEIALAIWRALPAFRGECSERSFVYRIAHNRCVDRTLRRRALPTADVAAEELPHAGDDAEATLLASQRQQRLFDAIQRLPLPARQLILLALEELTHAEIAEVLGISPNNVAVRLHRARTALRAALEEHAP